jgi:hypothetical protein
MLLSLDYLRFVVFSCTGGATRGARSRRSRIGDLADPFLFADDDKRVDLSHGAQGRSRRGLIRSGLSS